MFPDRLRTGYRRPPSRRALAAALTAQPPRSSYPRRRSRGSSERPRPDRRAGRQRHPE